MFLILIKIEADWRSFAGLPAARIVVASQLRKPNSASYTPAAKSQLLVGGVYTCFRTLHDARDLSVPTPKRGPHPCQPRWPRAPGARCTRFFVGAAAAWFSSLSSLPLVFLRASPSFSLSSARSWPSSSPLLPSQRPRSFPAPVTREQSLTPPWLLPQQNPPLVLLLCLLLSTATRTTRWSVSPARAPSPERVTTLPQVRLTPIRLLVQFQPYQVNPYQYLRGPQVCLTNQG